MIEIGRLCLKIAGREAGKKCIVVDVVDKNHVLIDGEVRRKKCNISHLEPLKQIIKIEKNSPHSTIVSEFKKLGIEIKEKKTKKAGVKPKKQRRKKKKLVEPKKEKKTKEAPKEEEKTKLEKAAEQA